MRNFSGWFLSSFLGARVRHKKKGKAGLDTVWLTVDCLQNSNGIFAKFSHIFSVSWEPFKLAPYFFPATPLGMSCDLHANFNPCTPFFKSLWTLGKWDCKACKAILLDLPPLPAPPSALRSSLLNWPHKLLRTCFTVGTDTQVCRELFFFRAEGAALPCRNCGSSLTFLALCLAPQAAATFLLPPTVNHCELPHTHTHYRSGFKFH